MVVRLRTYLSHTGKKEALSVVEVVIKILMTLEGGPSRTSLCVCVCVCIVKDTAGQLHTLVIYKKVLCMFV